jgi:hypothetical protein
VPGQGPANARFRLPHTKATATLNTTAQHRGGMTLEIEPDHGGISTAFFVSGTDAQCGRFPLRIQEVIIKMGLHP